MEILLRRASSLDKACGKVAQALERKFVIEPEIRFSAYTNNGENRDELETQLRVASQEAMQTLNDILDLYQAQATIRTIAGHANDQVVDPLVTERDILVKKAIATLSAFESAGGTIHGLSGTSPTKHDADQISAKLSGIAKRLAIATTDRLVDSFGVSRLSDTDRKTITDRIAEFERRQRDISDALGHDNVIKKIVLPDSVVTVLRKHKIV